MKRFMVREVLSPRTRDLLWLTAMSLVVTLSVAAIVLIAVAVPRGDVHALAVTKLDAVEVVGNANIATNGTGKLNVGPTGASKFVVDAATGFVGFNTSGLSGGLPQTRFNVVSGGVNDIEFVRAPGAPQINIKRVPGTLSAPTALANTGGIFQLAINSYDGTAFSGNQLVETWAAAENWAVGKHGTFWSIKNIPRNTTTPVPVMYIDSIGGQLIPWKGSVGPDPCCSVDLPWGWELVKNDVALTPTAPGSTNQGAALIYNNGTVDTTAGAFETYTLQLKNNRSVSAGTNQYTNTILGIDVQDNTSHQVNQAIEVENGEGNPVYKLFADGTSTQAGVATMQSGVRLTTALTGPLITSGSGVPALSATKGSLYLRTDTAQVYQNTDGATTWTQLGTGGTGGAFSGASVYSTTNQSIPNATYTAIAYNTERADVGGYHDNAVNNTRLTVPATGYYFIKAAVGMASNSNNRYIKIVKNGTTDLAGDVTLGSISQGTNLLFDSTTALLNAGDYVEVYVYQGSGGALNAIGAAPQTFDINLIGSTAAAGFSGVGVYNSTTQNALTATGTVATFDTESYDTGSYHSTSSNTSRLVAPVTGYYLVRGTIEWQANSTGTRAVLISKNANGVYGAGTSVAFTRIQSTTTGGNVTFSNVNATVQLNAGDYVELFGQQDSGSTLTMTFDSKEQFQLSLLGS